MYGCVKRCSKARLWLGYIARSPGGVKESTPKTQKPEEAVDLKHGTKLDPGLWLPTPAYRGQSTNIVI